MHLPVDPITFVNSTVGVLILAVAVHLPIHPIALKFFHNVALRRNVRNRAFSVPPVVTPLAAVYVALCVPVDATAVHLAVHPIALVLVAIRVRELAVTINPPVVP